MMRDYKWVSRSIAHHAASSLLIFGRVVVCVIIRDVLACLRDRGMTSVVPFLPIEARIVGQKRQNLDSRPISNVFTPQRLRHACILIFS
jgi:hypothetical protein